MTEERTTSTVGLILGVLGMLLYIVIGWLYLGSPIVMPMGWAIVMWAVWIGGLFVLGRVFRRHPMWTPAVPVGAVIFWVAVVSLGGWLLGWTA